MPADAAVPATTDPRLRRWLDRAAGDLSALRLALPAHPDDAFYAAGAPWFFTLFGRDSIWAARLALSQDPSIAASTLRVLARLQGTKKDPATAEAPGKIPHELRSGALSLPNEGVHLPPLYYGTVDATPLWVCLLADARDAGMPEDEVRELLPSLRAALGWMTDHGDASGSGFIDYVDETGHGLANQGWKDSGDSIQWRNGRLAEGPIALSEVQAYAYEAAVRVRSCSTPWARTAATLRSWAADLRTRFRTAYWVTTSEGRYPAIALDAHGAAVDTLTSNIGHLIGTGLLDPDEERACAALLLGDSMSSGFGIRTMSSGAAGFWPLSYHGGSVWAHDTAVAVHGMLRAGLRAEAASVARQLVDAAEGFDYRMPELHAGDSRTPGSPRCRIPRRAARRRGPRRRPWCARRRWAEPRGSCAGGSAGIGI
jgi:glycogen debranching enzyme